MEESRGKSGLSPTLSPSVLCASLRFLKQMAPAARLAVSRAAEVCEEVGSGGRAVTFFFE